MKPDGNPISPAGLAGNPISSAGLAGNPISPAGLAGNPISSAGLAGNPISSAGLAAMRARYDHLLGTERPAITEIVSWAAGNGDRSENGDYLYGRKRMREIDRELSHIARRMKAARVIDPAQQPDKARAYFGATVTLADDNDVQRIVTLVGDDEQDADHGRIGWSSPLARALRGAAVGETRRVTLPGGEKEWEVVKIVYTTG